MIRRRLIPNVLLLALTAPVGFVVTDRAVAAERLSGMPVISSDATARFMPLTMNKAVVIEVPADIKDVLVASPAIVKVYMLTNRRAYIVGTALGQTNVYFYDANGRQIGGLDISVTSGPQPAPLDSASPAKVIVVQRGPDGSVSYSCTLATCITPGQAEAANTQHSVQEVHQTIKQEK
jgi:pilus assembly protein CpaC